MTLNTAEYRGGCRIDCRGGLSIPRALARAKFMINLCATPTFDVISAEYRGGCRIDCRGGLKKYTARVSAREIYVLRPLLTSFPHTTCYISAHDMLYEEKVNK